MRYLAFKRKRNGLRDMWFVFDSALVLLMVLETWVMSAFLLVTGAGASGGLGNASILRMARLMRLTRMARMARLLRSMPELMILVRGMVAATRSVFFTLLLLAVILYVFAIAFRQLLDGTKLGDEWFINVPQAMHTLLVYGTFMDEISALAFRIQKEAPVMLPVFYAYVLIGSLTLLNMLIGVLCEVVTAVANTEKEAMAISYVKDVMLEILTSTGLDSNRDGKISKDEFLSLFDNLQALALLDDVGVDIVGLLGFADFLFEDEHDQEDAEKPEDHEEKFLSYDELMKLILDLRGSNQATVRDIVDLRKFVRQQFGLLAEKAEQGPSRGSRASNSGTYNVNEAGKPNYTSEGSERGRESCGGGDDNLQPLLRKLLDDASVEFKKWVKAELRPYLPHSDPQNYDAGANAWRQVLSGANTGAMSKMSDSCNGGFHVDKLLHDASFIEEFGAIRETPLSPRSPRRSGTESLGESKGVTHGPLPSPDLLGCIDLTMEDEPPSPRQAESAVPSPRVLKLIPAEPPSPRQGEDEGLAKDLARFREQTREMQQHLDQLMQKVDSQDDKLGSLTEALVSRGTKSQFPHGIAAPSSVAYADARHGQSGKVMAELIHSVCSCRNEMQDSLKCVTQKAEEQLHKFGLLAQLVVSIRRSPLHLSSAEINPMFSHKHLKDIARNREERYLPSLGCLWG